MRLAFDLDGVLVDLGSALRREASRLFPDVDGPAPDAQSREPEADTRTDEAEATSELHLASLTARQHRRLWDEVRRVDNFWETLDEIEDGMVRRLWSLTRERNWHVLFVTSRPSSAGDCVQIQTQRWLERKGFALPSVVVVHGSRGKVADALDLDVLVDDRPEHCLDVVLESRAGAILVWPEAQSPVPASAKRMKIGTVTSVAACLDLLEQADRPGDPGGMLARLRRLLGLNPTHRAAARR